MSHPSDCPDGDVFVKQKASPRGESRRVRELPPASASREHEGHGAKQECDCARRGLAVTRRALADGAGATRVIAAGGAPVAEPLLGHGNFPPVDEGRLGDEELPVAEDEPPAGAARARDPADTA